MSNVRLILREEYNECTEEWYTIAFYDDKTEYPNVMGMSFVEGHFQASVHYYHFTRPLVDKELADRFVNRYENHYDVKVELGKRLVRYYE